jgi:hypothetical protein
MSTCRTRSSDVITAEDLIICKALFNRPRDWIDIEDIFRVQPHLDAAYLRRWLSEFSAPEDARTLRIESLIQQFQREGGPERVW